MSPLRYTGKEISLNQGCDLENMKLLPLVHIVFTISDHHSFPRQILLVIRDYLDYFTAQIL